MEPYYRLLGSSHFEFGRFKTLAFKDKDDVQIMTDVLILIGNHLGDAGYDCIKYVISITDLPFKTPGFMSKEDRDNIYPFMIYSPLLSYANNGSALLVSLLLRSGFWIDYRDAFGRTALDLAARRGHMEVVKKLVDSKASPSRFGPILYAIVGGNVEILKLLCDMGYDHTRKNDSGMTSLMYAVESGNHEVIQYLYTLGCDIDEVNDQGESAMTIAIKMRRLKTILILGNMGSHVRQSDLELCDNTIRRILRSSMAIFDL